MNGIMWKSSGAKIPLQLYKKNIVHILYTIILNPIYDRSFVKTLAQLITTSTADGLHFTPPYQTTNLRQKLYSRYHVIKMSLGGACQTSLGPHIFNIAPD